MAFRRLSLTLILLSAPAGGDDVDLDDLGPSLAVPEVGSEQPGAPDDVARERLRDVVLHADGAIAEVVVGSPGMVIHLPWGLVRLVLGDLAADVQDDDDPLWLAFPPSALSSSAEGTSRLTLRGLSGRAVDDGREGAVGTVRGALVSLTAGRVLALAVDVGPYLGTEARAVAVPWSLLRVPAGEAVALSLAGEHALDWIRYAPEVPGIEPLGA